MSLTLDREQEFYLKTKSRAKYDHVKLSALGKVLTERTFSISSKNDENRAPRNVMDGDQKTFVHSADVGTDDFTQFSTLNITFG